MDSDLSDEFDAAIDEYDAGSDEDEDEYDDALDNLTTESFASSKKKRRPAVSVKNNNGSVTFTFKNKRSLASALVKPMRSSARSTKRTNYTELTEDNLEDSEMESKLENTSSSYPATPVYEEMHKSVIELIDGGSKKKQLSEEEMQLKKAEAARKRKHFNIRRLEAEKRETLDRLLLKKETKKKDQSDAESERQKKANAKKRVMIKHPALFNWCSQTKVVDGEKTSISYYSIV